MPTYTVSSPAGRLTPAQRSALALEITRAHERRTGAQSFFAQVVFTDVPQSHWFVGGVPIDADQIFIQGQVREGRSGDIKRALLDDLTEIAARISMVPRRKVWVYLSEIPAARMVEFGHVLPAPGLEGEWLASLPEEDRAFLRSLGH